MAHVVTIGFPLAVHSMNRQQSTIWPSFFNLEVCVACGHPPGATGCMKVDEVWNGTVPGIEVQHENECTYTKFEEI